MCLIFVFSVSDENFPHDEYFPIYGVTLDYMHVHVQYVTMSEKTRPHVDFEKNTFPETSCSLTAKY